MSSTNHPTATNKDFSCHASQEAENGARDGVDGLELGAREDIEPDDASAHTAQKPQARSDIYA